VLATCERVRLDAGSLDLIGCHGQTIFHAGGGARFLGRRIATTCQIGDGSVVAERTGVPVVSDFRTRDMAAGGRGAPLVPYVDYLLFRHPRLNRVALNIGGIANVTVVPARGKPDDVIAFDTGPGNMVVDALVTGYTGGKRKFDRGGEIAARGEVNESLLKLLLRDRFFRQKPPKTAGREQFGAEYVERLRASGLSPVDLIATATALTAAAVALGLERHVLPRIKVDELIVSGGGVHNQRMMDHLAGYLPGVSLRNSGEFGVDVDAKEAIAFAILAYETWHKRPSNLPSATGARHSVVLGKISY